MKEKQRIRPKNLILPLVCVALFLATGIAFGPTLLSDSPNYIELKPGLSPGYPVFLFLIRKLCFEKDFWIFVVVILQNLFAAFSVIFTANRMKKLFGISFPEEILIYVLLIGTYYSSAFLSRTRFLMMNSILTEGLAFPLFYLTFCLFLEGVLTGEYKKLLLAMGSGALLSLVRGQFQAFLLAMSLVFFIRTIKEKKGIKRILTTVSAIVICFAVVLLGGRGYDYSRTQRTASHSPGSKAVASHVLMSSDAGDVSLLSEDAAEAYEKILEKFEKKGWKDEAMPKSPLGRAAAIEAAHDKACSVMVKTANRVLKERGVTDKEEQNRIRNQWFSEFNHVLLPAHFPAWLYNYLSLAAVGAVRTIAVDRIPFPLLALALYLAAIVLMIVLFRKDRNSRTAAFMLLVLFCAAANILSVSLLIMCLSRYMIYFLPLFYLALYLMGRETLQRRRSGETRSDRI